MKEMQFFWGGLRLLLFVSSIHRGTSQGCSRHNGQLEKPRDTLRRPWELSTWKDPDFIPPDEPDVGDSQDICFQRNYKMVMTIAAMYPLKGTMVLVKGGNFTMGDDDEDLHYYDGEFPLRTVYVSYSRCMGM